MSGSKSLRRALLGISVLLLAATPARAEDQLTIRGAGFGHGVGMSQYGAQGFALNGSSYRDILAHYYTGTLVEPSGAGKTVRVLLQGQRGQGSFTGATKAAGRRLNPARTYRVRRGPAGTVELLSPTGRRMKRVAAPLVVSGRDSVVLKGTKIWGKKNTAYRGTLEFRPGYLGVQAVNAVSLDDYVRGVVGGEVPTNWHPEALKAQAVAARTYAVTTSKAGNGFEQYPDTRSQVYGGIAEEAATVDAAVAATAGELVTYQGQPAVTYFFSTSGGKTEDVENTPLGNAPVPWLKSVDDPYDDISPRHKWTVKLTYKQATKKLGNLVKGSFRGVKVTKRGKSGRVVTAEVVGADGRTATTGAVLRARLGLFDTLAYFTSVSSEEEEEPAPEEEPPRTDSTGGVSPGAMAARSLSRSIGGRVFPYTGDVLVEQRVGGKWLRVGLAEVGRRGRYSFHVATEGRYRIRFRGERGPVVRIR
jgi:stage II sporulation protein D